MRGDSTAAAARLLLVGVAAAVAALAVVASAAGSSEEQRERVTVAPVGPEAKRWHVPCSDHYAEGEGGFVEGCHPTDCKRVVHDNFILRQEVDRLIAIAETAMAGQPKTGGPCIADINSGYVMAGKKLTNIYEDAASPLFIADDYSFYKGVIERIRQTINEEFGVDVYFTSPTFITRIVGSASWRPASMHDEYWHPHCDKNNTAHYDYSGLLYLSTFEDDFTGGLFEFFSEDGQPEALIEPAAGRLLVFSSGRENPHRVRRVQSGTRYVLSFWFSCNEAYRFRNFLDGKAHTKFGGAAGGEEEL